VLLQRADIAMYAAKGAGRGVSRTYQPDMMLLTSATPELELLSGRRRAIRRQAS
jgi:predicted signal transduction protein with EAL and GGDEF domain